MHITRASEANIEPLDSEHFVGTGTRRDLASVDSPPAYAVVVQFDAATRNHWHRHAGGQLLYVLEGTGLVATRDGEPQQIGPGDFVHAAPGEEHWHGATDASPMTHLAIGFGETEWL